MRRLTSGAKTFNFNLGKQVEKWVNNWDDLRSNLLGKIDQLHASLTRQQTKAKKSIFDFLSRRAKELINSKAAEQLQNKYCQTIMLYPTFGIGLIGTYLDYVHMAVIGKT